MSRHRLEGVRPRYGRIAVATASTVVTAVAVLGGVGVLPAAADLSARASAASLGQTLEDSPTRAAVVTLPPAGTTGADRGAAASGGADGTDGANGAGRADRRADGADRGADRAALAAEQDEALPADSGTGRRVVYSEARQRVWLVERGDRVLRTYPVSGSVYDNLDPGTYSVYSRSEQAWGIDDSGTMKWFVRFTQGDRAAIGFHDIPVDSGGPVQSVSELGTPTSHGCIRQRPADARALWRFAPLGTTVVVTV